MNLVQTDHRVGFDLNRWRLLFHIFLRLSSAAGTTAIILAPETEVVGINWKDVH